LNIEDFTAPQKNREVPVAVRAVLWEGRRGMKKELKDQFNEHVESYRRTLLYHARISDWETFKAKAGRMFDYVESIEYSELERRFFKNFNAILVILIAIAIALFQVDFEVAPELLRFKNLVVFAGVLAGSFELYFYINYRTYVKVRMVHYEERREKFIRNIEQDFRSYVVQAALSKAA
jgi:hypothetical protein